jgi:hypothetical protein
MPFKRVGPDDYVSPSGRHWTKAQVRLYHATKGFKKKPKRAREVAYAPLSADAILQQERERVLEEAWTDAARQASAAVRRGVAKAVGRGQAAVRATAKAGVIAGQKRVKDYAAAQTRAKQRGLARAEPKAAGGGSAGGGKGKGKVKKPKKLKVHVGKAVYSKVNPFGAGREQVIPR